MDEWQRSMLRAADGFGTIAQLFMRTVGFLPDGHELVDEEVTTGGIVARFPDRSAEGWPGFEIRVPDDARFHMAVSSVFTRGAAWISRRAVEEVTAIVRSGLAGPDVRERRRAGRTTTRFRVRAAGFTVTVFEVDLASGRRRPSTPRPRTRRTMVQVWQKRGEDGMRKGMEARVAAFRGSDA